MPLKLPHPISFYSIPPYLIQSHPILPNRSTPHHHILPYPIPSHFIQSYTLPHHTTRTSSVFKSMEILSDLESHIIERGFSPQNIPLQDIWDVSSWGKTGVSQSLCLCPSLYCPLSLSLCCPLSLLQSLCMRLYVLMYVHMCVFVCTCVCMCVCLCVTSCLSITHCLCL